MNNGTKRDLQAWIRTNLGMTYSEWMHQKADVRNGQYKKYMSGVKINPATPLPAEPVKPNLEAVEA